MAIRSIIAKTESGGESVILSKTWALNAWRYSVTGSFVEASDFEDLKSAATFYAATVYNIII